MRRGRRPGSRPGRDGDPEGHHGVPGPRGRGPLAGVWYEDGVRRQCQAASEERLTAALEKVAVRLTADAPNLQRPGADLITWYLLARRRPADQAWSRKHADTQRRLCERFLLPVLGELVCEDIRVADMQRALNAAPTAGEGVRPAPVRLRPGVGRAGRGLAGRPGSRKCTGRR